ncbi:hypothetical protein WMF18_16720 [Sorangium sp. So ce315]
MPRAVEAARASGGRVMVDLDRRLECAMTVRDGRVLWDRDGLNARRYVPR